MHIKTASSLCAKPVRSSCQAQSISESQGSAVIDKRFGTMRSSTMRLATMPFGTSQQGSSTLLALFIVVVVVTTVVALVFGHKIGYQRGYHSMQTVTEQATINSSVATKELEDLRLSNKILTNEAATAKQELAISLANLEDLRENQQSLTTENRQVFQLNELYAEIISDKGGMPLTVLGAKIDPLPENTFEYGFDIAMLSSSGTAKTVNATLMLLDEEDFVEVPLEPSRYDVKGIERIRGRFGMPKGFKPLQIKLTLKSGGQEIEQLYDWKLGDRMDDMPLSLTEQPEVDENPIETE